MHVLIYLLRDFFIFLMVGLSVAFAGGKIFEDHAFSPLQDIMFGFAGAMAGGFLFDVLGITDYGLGGSFVLSIFGAAVFLTAGKFFIRTSRATMQRRF